MRQQQSVRPRAIVARLPHSQARARIEVSWEEEAVKTIRIRKQPITPAPKVFFIGFRARSVLVLEALPLALRHRQSGEVIVR
jgi:hypothetical protein